MKFLSLLFILLLSSCYAPERNCNAYKTGTFKYEAYVNGDLETTVFIRTETLQIEKYKGKTDTSEVRWINNCEFILTPVNPESILDQYQIHMKILETTQNSYTFQYNVVGEDQKETGLAIKVEN